MQLISSTHLREECKHLFSIPFKPSVRALPVERRANECVCSTGLGRDTCGLPACSVLKPYYYYYHHYYYYYDDDDDYYYYK